jgi:heme/copper-type cytochrome/quinol oxidase subunit 2
VPGAGRRARPLGRPIVLIVPIVVVVLVVIVVIVVTSRDRHRDSVTVKNLD